MLDARLSGNQPQRMNNNEVILRPGNPNDFRDGGLDELRHALEEQGFVVLNEFRESRGYGVTWWEVVYLTIGAVGSLGGIVESVLGWQERRRKRQEEEGKTRPQIVIIHGPNGEELKRVETEAPSPPE